MNAAVTDIPRPSVSAQTRALLARATEIFAEFTKERVLLPAGWTRAAAEEHGAMWKHDRNGLAVIESILPYEGAPWHRVSVSRKSRLPSWDDLKLARTLFIGETVECYQVFPKREQWVNDNSCVLHLWRSIDKPDGVLPDFRIAGTI